MENARNHEEMRATLLAKASEDDGFRAQLIHDPKAAIKEAFGFEVPDAMAVHVHEDTATDAHLVLPPNPALSKADMEAVAAGHSKDVYGSRLGPHAHDGSWSYRG